MAQDWSGRKLFCELLKILRLVKISILFGLILDCLWWCPGVPCGSVCVSKQGINRVLQSEVVPLCPCSPWPCTDGSSCASLWHPPTPWQGWHQHCPCLRALRGAQSWGVIQLVNSSQKHRSREIGTIHSSLQHFCLLIQYSYISAPHTRPPGSLREVDTASVHKAPFTVKHAAVAPQHLQNLLKEADKHSGARGQECWVHWQKPALCPLFLRISLLQKYPWDETAANMGGTPKKILFFWSQAFFHLSSSTYLLQWQRDSL